MRPKISVCIPAYNRATVLAELLESILSQDYDRFEIVIAEDCSPERSLIRDIASNYANRFPGKLFYYENQANMGFDGNIRHLFELASGEYIFFMGNDDLMLPGALSTVAGAINRHPNVGVVLRSYAAFDGTPENIVQTFRYFDKELFFPAGAESIATIYRRSVVIPGMVMHRESALQHATTIFDGTLLYQLYLVAEILVKKNAVFVPNITVLYRNGGTPDFGNSDSEKGKFEPQAQTPESSLLFIKGMLDIARHVEQHRHVAIFKPIINDIANYSYPILALQSNLPIRRFIRYGFGLVKMGLGRNFFFWGYWLSLVTLGDKRMTRLIGFVKRRLGHTPTLGKVYKGEVR